MRYPAYLEIGPTGHCIAYVFSLPGFSLRERRAADTLAALPAAIAAELARLGAPADPAIEVSEAERVEVKSDVEHGASTASFKYELRPTRDEDVALALDRMERARIEMASADDEAWRALADGEWWLLSRLAERPNAAYSAEPRERFAAVRAATIERLTNLLPGDRERHAVFGGEIWTTRKVLRRLACHARDAALATTTRISRG
jgi:hypothetical protein